MAGPGHLSPRFLPNLGSFLTLPVMLLLLLGQQPHRPPPLVPSRQRPLTRRDLMIITTTNLKGGSGKTTLAVNLASVFAETCRTLLVDLDTQADASLSLNVEDSGQGLKDVLSGGVVLKDAVVPTAAGFDLIPAGEAVGRVVPHVRPDTLLGQRRSLESYEVVVIDCPPGLGTLVSAAWAVADVALVPVDGPEALRAVVRLEQAWHDLHLDAQRIRVVPNRINRHRVLDREILRQARARYDGRVLAPVRESVVVRESAAWRKPVSEHEPSHAVTGDLRRLGQEVLRG